MTAAPTLPAVRPRPTVKRRADRGVPVVLGILLAAAVTVGAGAGTHWFGLAASSRVGSCPGGQEIKGAGASFPSALVTNWVAEFQSAENDQVAYNPGGAGYGIGELTSRLVDFSMTDEGLTSSERTNMTTAVGTVLTLPVLAGAVAVITNIPGYPGPLNLTGAELAAIYLGNISHWNDARLVSTNPGLAGISMTITTVHRLDPAGMTYVLTNLLSDDNTTWATTPSLGTSILPEWPSTPSSESATGNSPMLTDVSTDPGAIGYTDLYDAEKRSMAIASIQNPSGQYTYPSPLSARAAVDYLYNSSGPFPLASGSWSSVSWVNAPGAGDYPLTAMVYYLVPADPSRGGTVNMAVAEVLVGWLTWTLTTGEGFSSSSFPFVAPPPGFLTQDLAAIAAMTFAGQSIPACG